MTATDLVDRLAAHKTVGPAPRTELEWLATHGTLRSLATSEVVTAKGSTPSALFIVLEGRIALFVERAGGLTRALEWRSGDVTGMLPYSRITGTPGDTVALEPSVVLMLHRDQIQPLTHECHEVTSILVHSMVDRARAFTSSRLHDEKLVSLGKLSAGLAHELNNPAAAIERSAALLVRRLEDAEQAARTLGAARLSDEQIAMVDALRATCLVPAHGVRSPIQQAEREEAFADWREEHGLDVALSETLADTPVESDALDRLAAALDAQALGAALRSAASGCAVRALASEIQEASNRIAGLVVAIKGFTHMDQAMVAEPVDVLQSVRNTVAVLRAKARGKSAAVDVSIAPDLPRVRGFAGELNQIWANLIDNALDAIPEAGRVEVRAQREGARVVVRVVDNGPGIPADALQRIFDPFYTTKAMGLGSGLGLDIVRRLVEHNDADISVDSQPGHTEFRVALPIADGDGAGGAP